MISQPKPFYCISATEAFYELACELVRAGEIVSPRDIETLELLNVTIQIQNPRMRTINIPHRKWNNTLAVGELCWHWSASDSVDFISYYAKNWASFSSDGEKISGSCYGKHIFQKSNNLSQWDFIVDTLKSDPNSRQAILAMPYKSKSSIDLPCISTIQFMIRENKLICINNMRSNDLVWGFCYDVFFATMTQERLAIELGVELGPYIHNATSLHIYSRFFSLIEKITSEKKPLFQNLEMPTMSHIDSIQTFLDLESSLRNDEPEAISIFNTLPNYWKHLAKPLILKSIKNHNNREVEKYLL